MSAWFAPPPLPGIPGPREMPVLGSLVPFARDPLGMLQRLQREHGDLVQLTLANHRLLLVSDPELLETVFVTEWKNLHKDAIYEKTRPLLGNGLVTSEGDEWKRNRRLAAPSFTPRHIELYRQTMQDVVDDWVEARPADGEIDLFHEMMELTQRIVLKTLFGDVEVDTSRAAHAIDTVMEEFIIEVQGRRRFWPQSFPSRGRRRSAEAIAALDTLIRDIIAARRRQGLGDDLLSQLLAARDDEGRGMDDQQLRDEAVTMFAAGHETTATALTYALLLLATHPQEQRRLADDPERARPVLEESMRMLPPVWAIGRETQAPIQLGGHTIPANIQLLLAQCVVHNDPRWYEAPERFVPDRWIDPPERPRFAYFPFGGGPRVCIGNHFAMMEGAIALSTMVPQLRFEALGAVPPPAIPSITLRPKGRVPVRVTRR